jgi:hypothetical protein
MVGLLDGEGDLSLVQFVFRTREQRAARWMIARQRCSTTSAAADSANFTSAIADHCDEQTDDDMLACAGRQW